MKLQRLLPVLTVAALATTGGALAQQAAAPGAAAGHQEVRDERLVVQPFNLTVDQIDDMDVHGPGGEKIGEVDEVLMDSTGRPVAAVSVEVGGFLGIGGREVIVGFDRLCGSRASGSSPT
jgi:PRC-barrel domain protein